MEIHPFSFRWRALELWSQCYSFPPIHKLIFPSRRYQKNFRTKFHTTFHFICPCYYSGYPTFTETRDGVVRTFASCSACPSLDYRSGCWQWWPSFFVLSSESQRLILGGNMHKIGHDQFIPSRLTLLFSQSMQYNQFRWQSVDPSHVTSEFRSYFDYVSWYLRWPLVTLILPNQGYPNWKQMFLLIHGTAATRHWIQEDSR
jgi:hypothetical protein